jgi:flavin-dependent dehydrogenase
VEQAVAAGAELREQCPVRAVVLEPAHIRVQTGAGEVTARVLIGADGANGAVAKSLNLEPAVDSPVALEANFPYLNAPIRGNGGGPSTGLRTGPSTELRTGPSTGLRTGPPHEWAGVLALELGSIYGGYGWSFPKSDHFNVGCGGWGLEGARLREHLAELAPHYGLRVEAMENVRGHHVPTRRDGRPISKGNALLVGDAAGLVDPMSGEGIYAAFVSGRLAASAAADYLNGHTKTLASYDAAVERELMPDIRAAGLLRDAYHFLPGPSYLLMRRWPYLQRSVCQLMLGQKTYDSFLREAGPLRALVATLALAGRAQKRRRERARAPRDSAKPARPQGDYSA